MNHFLKIIILVFIPINLLAQQDVNKVLARMNSGEVPYRSVEELKMKRSNGENLLLLDARERGEFKVSHLSGAEFVGYSDFSLSDFQKKFTDKNREIVVYCSIGVRSENIAEKLEKAGFKNVFNLYGGIFEWKNKHYQVVDPKGETTEKVHAYSKRWGKLLHTGEKVYKSEKNHR
jgi:rhodanese-related sulfurtransferase